jgi:hypothetical protein
MRRRQQVLEGSERVLRRQGLGIEDVDCSSRDGPCAQDIDERLLVDDRAARRVDYSSQPSFTKARRTRWAISSRIRWSASGWTRCFPSWTSRRWSTSCAHHRQISMRPERAACDRFVEAADKHLATARKIDDEAAESSQPPPRGACTGPNGKRSQTGP